MTDVRFTATLQQAEGLKATGIEVPTDVMEQLGGKRPSVRVVVNGHEFRTTIGAVGGHSMIPVSAAVREAAGMAAGDEVEVALAVDNSPREVTLDPDFAEALDATPGTRAFFGGLSNSLQRYHADQVSSAKTEETKQRRIEKAVALFAAGKQR